MLPLHSIFAAKGIRFYHSDKFNLDTMYHDEPFQDQSDQFDCVFETDHKDGDIVQLEGSIPRSLFKYFLDGSRRTYKIGDITTVDGKFLPVVSGQIGVGVCQRTLSKTMRKRYLRRLNVLSICDSCIQGDDFYDIRKQIEAGWLNSRGPFEVLPYAHKSSQGMMERKENLAIAAIQKKMSDMELLALLELVRSNLLLTDELMVIDGSLQFMQTKVGDVKVDDGWFMNVVGISKSFNPGLRGVLKKKKREIGSLLPQLEYGQRTPVYRYPKRVDGPHLVKRDIGAWYLRIRPKAQVRNPLDGIVKVEKIAVTKYERDAGFESGLIDNISKSILLERNVTCYGRDPRWANHIYAMYLTEEYVKQSFVSDRYFINLL